MVNLVRKVTKDRQVMLVHQGLQAQRVSKDQLVKSDSQVCKVLLANQAKLETLDNQAAWDLPVPRGTKVFRDRKEHLEELVHLDNLVRLVIKVNLEQQVVQDCVARMGLLATLVSQVTRDRVVNKAPLELQDPLALLELWDNKVM